MTPTREQMREMELETQMTDSIPRRIRIDQQTQAEAAIRAAVEAVESLPADVRLTDAVVMLQAAKESVADYVDGVSRRPRCAYCDGSHFTDQHRDQR